MFSDTFAGIAPSSAPAYIAAQIGGGIAGVAIIKILYPSLTPAQAAGVIIPHDAGTGAPRAAGLAAADGAGSRGTSPRDAAER